MAYVWSRNDGSAMSPGSLAFRYLVNDIDRFVDVNDLSAAPAVGADFTRLVDGVIGEMVARCLCVTMFNANSGAARGITVRVRGLNQFGQSVEEYLDFGTPAANTTSIMFTRFAYKALDSVNYVERAGGAVQANDRLDVGVTCIAGTAAGTHVASNGAGATDYKAFGLPARISATDGIGTVAAADFPTQVDGCVIAQDAGGIQSWAGISRGNDFKCDATYHTMTPDEEFVLSANGNIEIQVTVTPNRRASESAFAGISESTVSAFTPLPV